MKQGADEFWNVPSSELLQHLETQPEGLTSGEAQKRLLEFHPDLGRANQRSSDLRLLLSQFKSPIILILIFAAVLSYFLHDAIDAYIILTIVLISGLLGFWQERGASNAVAKLLAMVKIKTTVIRDGKQQSIPSEAVVSGDIIILSAGGGIPGDCLLLEAKDCYVDEASLTGETYPVEKEIGVVDKGATLAQRKNVLFMGTHVVSGNAKAVVVHTGKDTEFGAISERLKLKAPETEFEHGVRRFGYLLLEVTLMLVIAIFAVNVFLHKPVLDSFMFSLALAVGLTPQLLPAIISINLAHGAKKMADQQVIVKRLAAIENFGSMNVLCSDKTGTLTEGVVHLRSASNISGSESAKVQLYAYLNAYYESGFVNPIDEAIRKNKSFDLAAYQKSDEVPYDFIRKRLTILVAKESAHLMVTKGAFKEVLACCSTAETATGAVVTLAQVQAEIEKHYEDFSNQGFRTLGIAYREIGSKNRIVKDDETGMTFLGFLTLFDPPKQGVSDNIRQLQTMGVALKIITGDNKLVAANLSGQIGLHNPQVLTGRELHEMSDAALVRRVNEVNIFAEVDPNQKERIILALRKAGNVVGYMGDGINDGSALHAADVGISVNSAVDVAKEAADIVLLEQDLDVLAQGVREGRRTFANTLKYVFMATSANFGNMFSMAGASLFLPFLPLLPKQILLTNLLTDFPEMTIASDEVDPEAIDKPRRWDIKFIRRFMITFGLVSSIFDFLTFGVLLFLLKASPGQFRTGWFLESVISASLIVLVIRTRKPFYRSRPGRYLLIATLLVVGVTIVLPFTQLGKIMGFTKLPLVFFLLMGIIVVLYFIAAELTKKIFYQRNP